MSALSRLGLHAAVSRKHQPFTWREWLRIGIGGAAFLLWIWLLVLGVMGAGEPGPLCDGCASPCTQSEYPPPPGVVCR